MKSDFLTTMRARVEKRVKDMPPLDRHCSLREATQIEIPDKDRSGLLRFARNDGEGLGMTGNNTPKIIAEIKFASPSRGNIYPGHLSPVDIAKQYRAHGACALSVLTEPDFFKGNIEYLRQIRQSLPDCPLLLKDFVLSQQQITQAHHAGASAVLLIVGFLDPGLLHDLYEYAISLALTPLIEIHQAAELEIALQLNPRMIGINNRNLHTLAIDLNTSRHLLPLIPKHIIKICESGLSSLAEVHDMIALGCDGFLMGSHFMQFPHPGEALGHFLGGTEHAR